MIDLNLKTWKSGAKRAPHKPLLLLYALGEWSRGVKSYSWVDVNEKVKELISRFGGHAKPTPHFPFVRLANDGIWLVEPLLLNKAGDMNVSDLNRINPVAQFEASFQATINDAEEFDRIVNQILESHFSETLHSDILEAVGLEARVYTRRKKRDPMFRTTVMDAYGRSCTICGYNMRYRDTLIGVEAAHLQWHNSSGPDHVTNGVALCSIHHKLLDYGAIGISDSYQLLVSSGVGGDNFEFWLGQYEGKEIALPRDSVNEPSHEYLLWQREQVFKG